MESIEQLKELSRRRNSHYRTTSKWLNAEKDSLYLFLYAYKNPSGYTRIASGNRKDLYAFLVELISDLAEDEHKSFNDVIASLIVAYHNDVAKNKDK